VGAPAGAAACAWTPAGAGLAKPAGVASSVSLCATAPASVDWGTLACDDEGIVSRSVTLGFAVGFDAGLTSDGGVSPPEVGGAAVTGIGAGIVVTGAGVGCVVSGTGDGVAATGAPSGRASPAAAADDRGPTSGTEVRAESAAGRVSRDGPGAGPGVGFDSGGAALDRVPPAIGTSGAGWRASANAGPGSPAPRPAALSCTGS
jgi:hypothetical protein